MNNLLKFVAALAVAFIMMFAFRALAFTIYTIPDSGLSPALRSGDRVLVNRWSYGLRSEGNIFAYGRWVKRDVERGDYVVFNNPADTLHSISCKGVMISRCKGCPGDTVIFGGIPLVLPGIHRMVRVTKDNAPILCATYNLHEHKRAVILKGTLIVDGKKTYCASFSQNYYWMETGKVQNAVDSRCFGLVPENHIIGRAVAIAYNKDDRQPLYSGYDNKRWLLPIQ
jgi:signal peptidase I